MRRRWLRLILVLGFVAAASGAGYALWTLDTRERAVRATQAAVDAEADRAARALADLSAALEAYVAVGQDLQFWTPRAEAALDAYAGAVAELVRLAPAAAPTLVNGEDLAALDRRARQLVNGEQPLVASDLLFTDGIELIAGAGARVGDARRGARETLALALSDLSRERRYVAGGALAVALLVVGLLVPTGSRIADESAVHFNVAPLAPPAAAAAVPSRTDPTPEEPPAVAPARSAAAPGVDLAAVADLCSDLCRVTDASTLPAVLAGAAGLIGARRLTLWIADAAGALHPSAAHGYSPQTLSRLGCIRPEDDNAAAAAYRTARVQVVDGDTARAGALVVPLPGVSGCVGVLAAELGGGQERHEGARAVARIVAAQLAMLIPPAEEARAAETPMARAESG